MSDKCDSSLVIPGSITSYESQATDSP